MKASPPHSKGLCGRPVSGVASELPGPDRAEGSTLKASCRESDFVGRVGGEEFLILLPDTSLELRRVWPTRSALPSRRSASPQWGDRNGRNCVEIFTGAMLDTEPIIDRAVADASSPVARRPSTGRATMGSSCHPTQSRRPTPSIQRTSCRYGTNAAEVGTSRWDA